MQTQTLIYMNDIILCYAHAMHYMLSLETERNMQIEWRMANKLHI